MRASTILFALVPAVALVAEAASDVLPDFAAWPPPSRRTALVVDGRAPVILAPAHAAGQA
ncbi:MAG: hypothetical protein GX595_03530, partial [Lentisphaerae bacterium]|nr:hypothetical protein [Lentisphaerota bacterium]